MIVKRTKQQKERSREGLGPAHQIGNAQTDSRAEELIDRLTKERATSRGMSEAGGGHPPDSERRSPRITVPFTWPETVQESSRIQTLMPFSANSFVAFWFFVR
jgi:hypothetical protein